MRPWLRAMLAIAVVALVADASSADGACEMSPDLVAKNQRREKEGKPPLYPDDVFVFDHLEGAIVHPFPTVLRLRDGEVFGIRFEHTAPSRFDYAVAGIESDKAEEATFDADDSEIEVGKLSTACLTWRHDSRYPVYRVTVTVREGNPEVVTPPADISQEEFQATVESLPDERDLFSEAGVPEHDYSRLFKEYRIDPEGVLRAWPGTPPPALEPEKRYLYSYTFPVWVETVGSRLTLTTGVAFSDLRNDGFFVDTDDRGTATADDDAKTVRQDRDSRDDFRPDIVALANLRAPETWGYAGSRVGLAFGVGLGDDAEPRYFFGPSVALGGKERFILTVGWTGGKVDALPRGQDLDEELIGDELTLDRRFANGAYAGITFSFGSKTQQEFLTAFQRGTVAKRTDDEKGSEPTEEEPTDD